MLDEVRDAVYTPPSNDDELVSVTAVGCVSMANASAMLVTRDLTARPG